jgi:glycosyltransferase involved in cell wall biosynthesis
MTTSIPNGSARYKHILFLSDNFPPEVNAPASRTFEHCREWVRAGCQVTVVTCAPNFPKGRVYDGYRNCLRQSEWMDGIHVIRVWSYITANSGFARRIMDYASFMISAILAAPFISGVDIVVGTSPQFFTACAAFAVSRMKRVPFVFELRDIWPESIKAVGAMKDSAVIRFLEKVEMFLYRNADLIVTVTESFKRILMNRGVDGAKVHVVTNGVDVKGFSPRDRDAELTRRLGLEGKFVAEYVVTHGMAHGLETILEAASRMSSLPDGDRFRFLFLGDGARKAHLVQRASEMHLTNVVFVDSVPKSEVARYWSLLDVSIIHLRKTTLFTTVIPSKLFECMGMGIPVLLGVAGESADIVEKEDVGLVFEPEDAAGLCDSLIRLNQDTVLYHRLRTGCLKAAGHYDRSALAARMLKVLDGLKCAKRTAK